LQCVVIVNVEGVSWVNSGPDLMTWYLHDVQSHFPGMLAAVFIQGHSWVHSRMWNIIKHVLSPAAQSKTIFLSREELVDYFGVNALPQDYGGSLPHLHILPDLLNHRLYPSSTRSRHHRTLSLPSPSTADTLTNRPLSLDLVAATHSPANPFFWLPCYSRLYASTSRP